MSSRSPMWYCYECHAEMRPLMIPDPHCASCHGTFVEEISGATEDDPRQIAAENEHISTIHNWIHGIAGGSAGAEIHNPRRRDRDAPINQGIPGLFMGQPIVVGGPNTNVMGRNGGAIRLEVRSGPGGRSWTIQQGGGNIGGHPIDGVPSFQEFMTQRISSAPTSPIDDEIETPYGPRFRRPGEMNMPPPPLDGDPRAFLMQYLMGLLSGNPSMLFEEHAGPFQGGGAFGDYVFSQEGLDRIVTQLMEAAGHAKPNPAPEELITNLKRTPLTYDCDLVKSGQSCAICTEYFAPPDPNIKSDAATGRSTASKNVEGGPQRKSTLLPEENASETSGVAITLPCDHAFHDECIIQWLKTSGTCPVCRYALVEQPNSTAPAGATAPGRASTAAGAASTSSAPPPAAPAPIINIPRDPTPSTSSRPTNQSTPNNQGNEPAPPPERQAQHFFNALGGPVGALQSVFGFVTGHGRNRSGDRSGNDHPASPTSPMSPTGASRRERITTPLPANAPTPTTIRVSTPRLRTPTPPRGSNGRNSPSHGISAPSPTRILNPPLFFRDRGVSPTGGQPNNGSRSNSNQRQDHSGTGNRGYMPGGWEDVD